MPVLDRKEVEAFLRERKEEHFGSMTIVAAAKRLHCDPQVVKNLFSRGLLKGERKPRGIFLDTSAVEAFASEYISCAAIASIRGTQSLSIVQHCKHLGIYVTWHPKGKAGKDQPFIQRIQAEKFGLLSNSAIQPA